MVMRKMREGAAGGIGKFLLFGILVLAVGGLVLMDVGGFFRGGVSAGDAARVGKEKISLAYFDRSVRRALARTGIQPEDAIRLGYVNEILGSEVRSSLIHQAARDYGIRVSRERVARQINEMIEPMVTDGQSPQAVLDQVLRSQGLSEGEFVRAINREMASTILAQALQAGTVTTPEDVVKDMYIFNNEKRDIEMLFLSDKSMKEVNPPAEEQLRAMYESTKENYAAPETRKVSLAFIRDSDLKNALEISEEEIKEAYDDNIESYSTPEERLIEQAALKSQEDAKKVVDLVKGGADLKKAVEEATGETIAYIGEARVQKSGLLDDIAKPVFGSDKAGEIIGPIKSPLGWQVLVLKEIFPPHVKPFSEVRAELLNELKQAKASDQLYEHASAVDDMLAGGGGFEDAVKEFKLEVVTLEPFNTFGQNKSGGDALEKYKDYRETVVKTAYELFEGETSAVMEMPDGKFAAIHVEEVTPKTYKPFEDVKGQIEKKWIEDQRKLNNRMKATALITQVEQGAKTLAEIAKEEKLDIRKVNLSRAGDPPAPLDPIARNIMFSTAKGEPTLLSVEGGTAIARVVNITLPGRDSIPKKEIEELHKNLDAGARNEAMMMFLDARGRELGVKINPKAIQSLYGAEVETP